MADAVLEVQKALIALAKAAVDPVPVYNFLPPEISMPYVVYSNVDVSPNDDKASYAYIHRVQFEIFMEGRGEKGGLEVAGQLMDGLQMARPVLTGFSASPLFFDSGDSMVEMGGEYTRVTRRFKLWTCPA